MSDKNLIVRCIVQVHEQPDIVRWLAEDGTLTHRKGLAKQFESRLHAVNALLNAPCQDYEIKEIFSVTPF